MYDSSSNWIKSISFLWDWIHRYMLINVSIMKYLRKECKIVYKVIMSHNENWKWLSLKVLGVACKKAITRKCYKPDPLTQDDWLKMVSEIYVMEKLTHKIQVRDFHTDANIEQTVETSWQPSVMTIFVCIGFFWLTFSCCKRKQSKESLKEEN